MATLSPSDAMETLHTPASLEPSTEKTTGLPEAPPLADRVAETSTLQCTPMAEYVFKTFST